jgi:uncharacterized OB-fold protein
VSESALLPVPDERSAPFFDGALAGRLMLQRCAECETWLYPVRTRCPRCASSSIEWATASGRGHVYSHGRLWRAVHPSQQEQLPIQLVVVQLAEGVRMSAKLIDADPKKVRAGVPVEVTFEKLTDELAIPVFRLAGD